MICDGMIPHLEIVISKKNVFEFMNMDVTSLLSA